MDVHNTSVSDPSSVQLPAPDPSLNVCDPRATIWFLLRSSHVCSSRTAPYRLGLRCTATTVLLSVYLPFQRHEVPSIGPLWRSHTYQQFPSHFLCLTSLVTGELCLTIVIVRFVSSSSCPIWCPC
ncbi:hypothetical protein ACOSP7_025482 [Xanthoceras sorbifolium]